MNVICIDPVIDPQWRTLIENRHSSVFHTPEWMQVMIDTYGMNFSAYLVVDEDQQPVGGVPFAHVDDIRGHRILTLPFSDYCDPLVDEPEHWEAVADLLTRQGCPVTVRCLHNSLPLNDERFQVGKQAMWHSMDIRPDTDTLWSDIHSSARRAIRKASQNDVEIRIADSEADLRAFFDIYVGLRKYKYRLVAQPYTFFQNIWKQFVEPGNGFLLGAYYKGQLIAGIFFLEWADTLCYKFNASHPDYLEFRPNNLLLWEGVKLGKDKGLQNIDLGLSDLDQDGLIRYKSQFAKDMKHISFLQHRPAGMPEFAYTKQASSLLPQLTDLFTDESVPDEITEKAGALLYTFFA